MKLKSSVKRWVNLWGGENDGSFLPDELSDHDVVPKTLPGDVFSSTITYMKISKKFMKIFCCWILGIFSNLTHFWRIFSLLNYIQKMTLTMSLVNKWWPNYKNDKIREEYFSYFVQILSALEEQINLNIALFNHCLSQFLYIL